MKHIVVMSKQMANLIAAGEVVERPASIVKELTENSIDAGATKLTVEIKNGGKSYIRVTDNGSGISKEDIPLAFVSHATSKVRESSDLASISTLGFRGEALASIAAVSRVEVLTCADGEDIGTSFVVEGGKTVSTEPAGCPRGTTMVVRDVFFNTPARMKFLKKDVSEANQVAAVMDRIALSHPEVAITFIREGKQVLSTSGDGELKNTIFSVFGKDFYSTLLDVDYTLNGVRVWGYITRPTACKANRSMQYFFVGGRQIRSTIAMVALDEAYKHSIMVGKVPGCVLHIDVDPQFVDVNVHPAKTEVRFQNEKSIYDAVYYGTKSALEVKDTPKQIDFAPKTVLREEDVLRRDKSEQITFGTTSTTPTPQTPPKPKEDFWVRASVTPQPVSTVAKSPSVDYVVDSDTSDLRQQVLSSVTKREEVVPSTQQVVETPKPVEEDTPVTVIGEVFKTYIIAQKGSEVLFIDKHAAHERMIFEELKTQQHTETQLLLEPVVVTLSKDCYQAVLDNVDALQEVGFLVEDFGVGTVKVTGYPLVLSDTDITTSLEEIAGYLCENKNDITPEFLDWVYHNVACRAAIKAGNDLKPVEMQSFVEKLLKMPNIRYCPHGRPVLVSMTKYSFEKQFGRIQ